MKKNLKRSLVTLCLLLSVTSLSAQSVIGYVHIPEINGPLEGDFIELLGLEHQVYVPYSVEEGRIIGNPVLARVKLTKYIDETSPELLNTYYTAKYFPELTITLLKMNPDTRQEEPYYTLTLKKALIVSIINQRDEETDKNIEEIELTAETFRWTSVLNNVEYEANSQSRAKLPQTYNRDIGKVYFYDENGDLIEGSEPKQLYSSRFSNFDIRSHIFLDPEGRPAGNPINDAIWLQREIDQASVKLIQNLFEMKSLDRVKIALERINEKGILEEYMWYELEDVSILANEARTLSSEDQLKGNYPFIEDVTLFPRRMTWEHISGGGGSSENPNFADFFAGQHPDNPIDVNVSSYPNPFNSQTRIEFALPSNLITDRMDIAIYDISGRLINTLFDGIPQSQNGYVIWDGKDLNRKQVSTGSYFFIVRTGEMVKTGKIVHVK